MKNALVHKITLCAAAVALLSGVSTVAVAHNDGYLIDGRGVIVRDNFGECWRTGSWTPAMEIADCSPDLAKKLADEAAAKAAAEAAAKAAAEAAKVKPAIVPAAGPDKPAVKAEFKAETLFDFDKSVVKMEGQKVLDDKIVTGMKEHPEVEMLLVTGHTDRIGSDKYNQKLSERRAAAVKDYLVKQGVAANRIRTVGKGESEPNPDAGTKANCKGNKKTKKLIACLQPDRRVTVEPEIQVPTKK